MPAEALDLTARRAELMTELAALEAKTQQTEEDEKRFDALVAEVDTIDKSRQAEARAAERKAALAALEERSKQPQRAAVRQAGPTTVEVRDRAEKFDKFGEMLQAVRAASGPDARVHPVLRYQADRYAAEVRAATGLGESQPSVGGFLVQQDFSAEILRRMTDVGGLMARARQIEISPTSNGLKINALDDASRANGSRWGGVRGYWVAEAGAPTASKPTFRQMELTLKKVAALVYCTEELLADSAALESIVMQACSEELAFKVEDAMINGTGAGQPLGVLNAGCLHTVSAETGQTTANPLMVENLVNMWAAMPARMRANAVWHINQNLEPYLYLLGAPVGTGGALVYMPAGGLSQAPYGTLFGRPVIPTEYNAAANTTGDILLCNWQEYVMIRKGGIAAATSIHVQFLYDEQVMRFILRVDGMPTWDSVLTPYKGTTSYQSPFVALATRS